jgi:hypothetical protein
VAGLILAFTLFMFVSHVFFPEPTVEDYPKIENLMPLPVLFSVLGLAVAFRWEVLGGVLSLVFFALHLLVFWLIRGFFFPLNMLVFFSPLPISAILFVYLGRRDKTRKL